MVADESQKENERTDVLMAVFFLSQYQSTEGEYSKAAMTKIN